MRSVGRAGVKSARRDPRAALVRHLWDSHGIGGEIKQKSVLHLIILPFSEAN